MGKQLLIQNKPIGLTPLQLIQKIREENKELEKAKIGYAGRLDPMARGVMLLMINEECLNRDKYQDLEKEYEFDVLLGVETDTNDVLGKIISQKDILTSEINLEDIKKNLNKFIGNIKLQYHPFSSFPIQGKPLFWWALNNPIPWEDLPKKDVEIKLLEILDVIRKSKDNIRTEIVENLRKVDGEFRQSEVISGWEDYFKNLEANELQIVRFRAVVSSGTYIRSLVHYIGEAINTPLTVIDLNRIRVGEYKL